MGIITILSGMKILGICGSPTKGGNCEKVLDFAFGLAERQGISTERILLSKLKIGPCISCGRCKTEKKCCQNDDFNSLIGKLEGADALLLVSPCYMGCMSGQMKCFLDRSVLLRRQGFLLKNKFGAAIAVGGSRNGGQELAIMAMHSAMHIHGMLPVGDDSHFGGILHAPAMEDKVGLETVKGTMDKLCGMLKGK